MPACFPLQILNHDTGENNQLGVDSIEDAMVGEVEPVGDVC